MHKTTSTRVEVTHKGRRTLYRVVCDCDQVSPFHSGTFSEMEAEQNYGDHLTVCELASKGA